MNHSSKHITRLAVGLIFFLIAVPAAAITSVVDDTFYILPNEVPFTTTVSELQENDLTTATSISITDPLHGTLDLDDESGILTYVPDSSFWALGTDSFTYTVFVNNNPIGTATVLLIARVHGQDVVFIDFEEFEFGALTVPPEHIDQISIDPDAAIEGSFGMQAFSNAYAYYRRGGKGDDNGSIKVDTRSPFPGDINRLVDGAAAEIITIGPEGLEGVLKILLREEPNETLSLGVDAPALSEPQWFGISEGANSITVDWWKPEIDGVLLAVDGDDSILLENIGIADFDMTEYRIGTMVVQTGYTEPQDAALDYDNILIRMGEGSTAAHTSTLVDGFENGFASGWSNLDKTSVKISNKAAITGAAGLEVDFEASPPAYLSYEYKGGARKYRGRFLFDPNSAFVNGDNIVIFAGLRESGDASKAAIRVRVKKSGGKYRIRPSHNGFPQTTWHVIGDRPVAVEVDWRAASHPTSNDGYLILRVDGEVVRKLEGLQNDNEVLRSVLIGADNHNGLNDSIFFDNYESWAVPLLTTRVATGGASPTFP